MQQEEQYTAEIRTRAKKAGVDLIAIFAKNRSRLENGPTLLYPKTR